MFSRKWQHHHKHCLCCDYWWCR